MLAKGAEYFCWKTMAWSFLALSKLTNDQRLRVFQNLVGGLSDDKFRMQCACCFYTFENIDHVAGRNA
jgi:hypothetical protein